MALANFLESFSELNVTENNSQQTWNQFLIFDFAALRRIQFVDNEMLRQASEILRQFIRSSRTKIAFLANQRYCLTHSLNYLCKELFLLCKHFDDSKENVMIDLLELFKEICLGLLKVYTESKNVYPMDGCFSLVDLLIESNCPTTIKLQSYSLIELLLKLVISKRCSIEDKTPLISAVNYTFSQPIADDDLAVIRCIASIYLKGVNVNLFDPFDLLNRWIEVECIGRINQDIEESALTDILCCISALCKVTENAVNNLINKLDVFICLSKNKALEHDLVVIISKAVLSTCRKEGIVLPFENFLANQIKEVLRQWDCCTNDLIFIVLYLQFTYSRLTLSDAELKRKICTKLDEHGVLSESVLKAIALLFPLTFDDNDSKFKEYTNKLLETIAKLTALEQVIVYDKNQFYWIMKNSNRNLQWKVLKLWIKNCQADQTDLILQVIQQCNCIYLLPEYLKTDIRENIGPLIKSLNDPELSRILCEMMPNHLTQIEAVETFIKAGAAVPSTEEFSAVYLRYFFNIIIHKCYKGSLASVLQYICAIVRQYKTSDIIAHLICQYDIIQGVLNAVYGEKEEHNDTWNHAVNILYMSMLLQVEHKIVVKQQIPVDTVKLLSKSKNSTKSESYVHKYNTIMKLSKHILTPPNTSTLLELPSEITIDLLHVILDAPDNADLITTNKVLIKLLDLSPDIAFLATMDYYICYVCRTISTDSHFGIVIRLLKDYLQTRRSSPWSINARSKASLLCFAHRYKERHNVEFMFEYFKNSAEVQFAKEILKQMPFF